MAIQTQALALHQALYIEGKTQSHTHMRYNQLSSVQV